MFAVFGTDYFFREEGDFNGLTGKKMKILWIVWAGG